MTSVLLRKVTIDAVLLLTASFVQCLFISGYTQLKISQHELVIANDFLPNMIN